MDRAGFDSALASPLALLLLRRRGDDVSALAFAYRVRACRLDESSRRKLLLGRIRHRPSFVASSRALSCCCCRRFCSRD
jgi:hypothetical protein